MLRHSLPILVCLVSLAAAPPADTLDPAKGKAEGNVVWYDARSIGVEGQGWTDLKAPYDRLPAKAEKLVRKPVWDLSRQSAGLCVRFRSDATTIQARWTLTSKNLAMPHMPAVGVSGLDLYTRDDAGKWCWLGVGWPKDLTATSVLASGLPAGKTRDFLLYLPLYNGVSAVEIGLPKGAKLVKPAAYAAHKKPIVFYGTSITQGGCASRPGMVHTSILGRMLEWPVINLGFSGNGRMEPELAQLLGEIDAGIYVLDCLPNMTADDVEKRFQPFVEALRKAKPQTPIILVEDRSYTNAKLLPGVRQRNTSSRAAMKKAYDKMVARGVDSLHYQPGEHLLGDDGEGAVDSSHPTDLGFMRQAQAMLPLLKSVLPTPIAPRAIIEGYPNELSFWAGDLATLCVSCSTPTYSVDVARIGAERISVWKKANIPGKEQKIQPNASSHGCGWKINLGIPTTKEWRSGYYSARLTADLPGGKKATSEVFFVVRTAMRKSNILLILSTNTYNAYCNWGGYSLYAYNGTNRVQGRRVSFERPIAGQFGQWEQHFVAWAEKAGYEFDYAVNGDLEDPKLLNRGGPSDRGSDRSKYRLVLSVGHDEYWSKLMRDNLEKYIAEGGNVAFLSGNTCCWQVRTEQELGRGKALVCYKQAFEADPQFRQKDHNTLTTLWSHHLVKRPENTLTGVGFLWGGYHLSHGQFMDGSGAFTVHRPTHWVFAGTDLKRGASFGGKDTIVGYECDGCELTWKEGLPSPTFRDGTPRGFEVLCTAPARWHPGDCEWYDRWEKGRTGNAVMGIYKAGKDGGTVITTGTTDWAHGLRGKDPAVERITKNILDKLGK